MVSIYPNPNNGIFDLQFTVYNLQRIGIKIFDLNGKELMTVLDKEMLPGDHTIKVDTKDLPAGIYVYRVLNATDQLIGFGKVVIM